VGGAGSDHAALVSDGDGRTRDRILGVQVLHGTVHATERQGRGARADHTHLVDIGDEDVAFKVNRHVRRSDVEVAAAATCTAADLGDELAGRTVEDLHAPVARVTDIQVVRTPVHRHAGGTADVEVGILQAAIRILRGQFRELVG